MRRGRHRSIQELRHAIDSLPLRTRVAMLEGIEEGEIIIGAYTSDDGDCPMLAAHRRGGRTNAEGFARTWDTFGGANGRRARRATSRELLILTTHLELSLQADRDPAPDLALAIAEHRRLVAKNASLRPGDRDRSAELRRAQGWAWLRPFRRYDDYQRALQWLESQPAEVLVRPRAPAVRS